MQSGHLKAAIADVIPNRQAQSYWWYLLIQSSHELFVGWLHWWDWFSASL